MKAGALDAKAISFGQMWLSRYSDDPGFFFVADRLLRLSQVSDSDWSKIASQSLSRLSKSMLPRDVDYTFFSILRRRQLLSQDDDCRLYELLCVWLKQAEQDINQLLNRPRPVFFVVAKKLAASLPLVAHLKDIEFQTEFEEKAKDFRKAADKGSREKFDQELWRLFRAHSWPNYSIGRGFLYRLGMVPEMGKIIATLNMLIQNQDSEIDSSLTNALDEALLATEAAIEESNFQGAGFLLAKMLPLSAMVGTEYLDTTILLVRHFMHAGLPVNVRCGFILECDRLIAQHKWSKLETAFLSFQRAGFDTPKSLEFFAKTQSTIIKESVLRTLDFLEELFENIPLRVGLFLPPLIVCAEMSCEVDSIKRCRRLLQNFLESQKVSEAIKSSSLPTRLKDLIGITMPCIPDIMQNMIETLGLQTPWLMELAENNAILNVDDLKRHLLVTKTLIKQNFPTWASFLLAPLLLISSNSQEDEILKEVCGVILEVLDHPQFSHESRDGFMKVCREFKWPNIDLQDDLFQFLGIGAPKLFRLLSEPEPSVSSDLLQSSLKHAKRHLISERPRGAYQILLNALPLASWTGDEVILECTIELAQEFMACSKDDKHITDLFSKGCVQRLQKGQWQNSEVGLKSLTRIGIRTEDYLETFTNSVLPQN
jgi:hypothetical protein